MHCRTTELQFVWYGLCGDESLGQTRKHCCGNIMFLSIFSFQLLVFSSYLHETFSNFVGMFSDGSCKSVKCVAQRKKEFVTRNIEG